MKKFFTLILAVMCLCTYNTATAQLQQPGKFYIMNVLTGNYVILQSSMLADITADAGSAEVITVNYDLQDNGEGVVTELYSDNGDMIATLNFIKSSFATVLEAENYPTDYLDEMFTLRLVLTGDDDGSVYLCVDVPEIENFDEIRSFLIEASDNQQAIVYYLSHMVPGNRHYLAVDYDDSFGFRVQSGEDSKWIMIPFDETFTAISDVNADQNTNAPKYDLMGRKVTNPTGLYIQNGKVKF